MKTLGRRSLVLIVLAILLVALPGCQGKTLEPSAEATPEEIIRSMTNLLAARKWTNMGLFL